MFCKVFFQIFIKIIENLVEFLFFLYIIHSIFCDRGEIGRRAVLRSLWGNPWKFKSSRSHQVFIFYISPKFVLLKKDLIFSSPFFYFQNFSVFSIPNLPVLEKYTFPQYGHLLKFFVNTFAILNAIYTGIKVIMKMMPIIPNEIHL